MGRRSTSTSAFGVSKRENHDASGFYRRFTPPVLSASSDLAPYRALDKLVRGDARHMDEVPASSVALVVTSPPYFAGKEYEASLGQAGAPSTYLEYLELLREVFAECVKKLEPGGRIAVNVANLGRRPYRSLASDVTTILQDDLRLLLRGEIIWVKQRGSSGSCAWGSFQRPGNPVLRDLTERVVIASKGRFDRAVPAKARQRRGLPSESSMTREDFMENTLDVWEIPAESARRVGHPAPFPVELPARLIELYTYRGDLVLDPFVGSGTTAVAALRTERHFAGYDLEEPYIALAEKRVENERQRLARQATPRVSIAANPSPKRSGEPALQKPMREGQAAKEIARSLLSRAGFTALQEDQRQPGGVEVSFIGRDKRGRLWLFDVAGSFTTYRPGLKRADVLWRSLAKAAVLRETCALPLVLLAPEGPGPMASGADALRAMTGHGKPIFAVIEILRPSALHELRALWRGNKPA
ncbi:MAG TPA: site-specific DNA-methyltransferase [Acidimicrobiales bacterium]|nr:site-specific DNA-methyltransferase [Acidimicrobiales bacterium]